MVPRPLIRDSGSGRSHPEATAALPTSGKVESSLGLRPSDLDSVPFRQASAIQDDFLQSQLRKLLKSFREILLTENTLVLG
jgi:hypothetical protein